MTLLTSAATKFWFMHDFMIAHWDQESDFGAPASGTARCEFRIAPSRRAALRFLESLYDFMVAHWDYGPSSSRREEAATKIRSWVGDFRTYGPKLLISLPSAPFQTWSSPSWPPAIIVC